MDVTEPLPQKYSLQALPVTPRPHVNKVTINVRYKGDLLGKFMCMFSRETSVS